jgi:hypothetical protein
LQKINFSKIQRFKRQKDRKVDQYFPSVFLQMDHYFPGIGGSIFFWRVDHFFLDNRTQQGQLSNMGVFKPSLRRIREKNTCRKTVGGERGRSGQKHGGRKGLPASRKAGLKAKVPVL